MDATVKILHRFDGIIVGNYKCHAGCGFKSGVEYTPHYTLIFLLKGSFRHKTFRESNFLTSEVILFKKPGFDYEAIHEHHIHDDCFYIEFDNEVVEKLREDFSQPVRDFLQRKDQACILLESDPWKHFITWQLTMPESGSNAKLHEQSKVVELITSVLGEKNLSVTDANKALHDSIDKAKQFMVENFINNISIDDIADASHVSPFHFSRVFKKNTNLSPHQFLLQIRINNSCNLLLNTQFSIAEVGYSSGFPNPDYFVTLFKEKIGLTPTQFRLNPGKKIKVDFSS